MDLDSALNGKSTAGESATELLRQDHAHVSGLFDDYQQAMDEESDTRQALAQRICMQLELHSHIELELFYPAVQQEDPELVADAIDDHHEIAATIVQLRELPVTSDDYDARVLDLMDLVEAHVAEEEDELFPTLEERMPQTLQQLGEEILRFKERMVGSTEELSSRT